MREEDCRADTGVCCSNVRNLRDMIGDNTVEQKSIFNMAASSTERNHHGGERRAGGWWLVSSYAHQECWWLTQMGEGEGGGELLLPISCSRGGSAGGWLLTDNFLTPEPELCRRLLPSEPGPQLPVRASVLMRAKATGGRPQECSHRHNEADWQLGSLTRRLVWLFLIYQVWGNSIIKVRKTSFYHNFNNTIREMQSNYFSTWRCIKDRLS